MRIAVLGLGAMGSRIAGRLLDAGHDVVVWNRTAAKAKDFPEIAASPAAAADEADAVITMLANPEALREVTRGIAPRTLIEMSTVGPAAIHELSAALPAETDLLDAPVLGSRSEAETGTLQIFVGATPELYGRWAPVLEALGTPHRVGGLGAGAAAKLVANSTLFGTLALLGEALRLAERLGLSRETAFEVFATTPIAAQAERRREALEQNEFPPRFPLSLARKDAELVAAAAADLRLAQAARSWLADADQASWGERDYSALLAWILESTDEQQDQRDQENDEQPVVDRKSAYEREDDQQQH
jgi:3-hydroxyisobutyrate dehydrogenase-like beta-hydroxyacid dehydrogenase